MDLAFQDFGGDGRPLIVMHGLFGSANNWQKIGLVLRNSVHVFALDMRNHGRSPHADSHTLHDMVEDLEEWIEGHCPENPILLGHSMGGLAAMAFAVTRPGQLKALVAADIAPRVYRHSLERELRALRTDISRLRSRRELDLALRPAVPEEGIRQFLLMNAERAEEGYRWRINVPVLARSGFLSEFPSFPGTFDGPALFAVGGDSTYVVADDHELIRRRFPAARIETIPTADHWLHYTAQEAFTTLVMGFLESLDLDSPE